MDTRARRTLTTLGLIVALTGCSVALTGCGGSDPVAEMGVDDTGSDETASEGGADTSSPGDDTGGAGDDTGGAGDDTGGAGDAVISDTTGDDAAADSAVDDGSADSAIADSTVTDSATTDSATADATDDTSTADTAPTLPTLSISDVTVAEGNTATTAATFTVTLSAASSTPVTVAFATADGTATASDYVANSGTITFPAGTTSQAVTVLVNGDTLYEASETFAMNLSSPSGATLAKATGTGTITNDDTAPALSINDVSANEGNSGTASFTFTVNLSTPSGVAATVNWATAGATATSGTDFTAASGALTFAPGDIAKTITVSVIGDTTTEPTETFTVTLSGAADATIAKAVGTGTILNDDGAVGLPAASINDVTLTEGNTGTKTATFTVTLSASPSAPVSITYATADGTATAPGDYVATSGTLNFAAGETSKTINVIVNGDTVSEADETFNVNLTGATGATIADPTGLGTITNDDTIPSLSIASVTKAEGNSGTTAFTFTVTLSSASASNVTVQYSTANGTATGGASLALPNVDFQSVPFGLLTFAAGETSKTITINVKGDTTVEPNETFTVTLASPTNATIATATATGTITNDD